jgi:membrane protease YdiL (CAAX protease family)
VPLFIVAGITKIPWITVPGLFGPAIAAVIVASAAGGQSALRTLLGRFLIWRISPLWFGFALLFPAVTYIIASSLAPAASGSPTLSPSRQWYLIPVVYVGLYLLVIGEELGWRGFALPLLQKRWSAVVSSLVLAIPWTIWHFAILTNPVAPNLGSIAGVAFIPFVFAIAIIFAATFNNTAGSILAVLAYHASGDVTGFFLKLTAKAYDINVAITIVVAVILVVLLGPKNLSRTADRVTLTVNQSPEQTRVAV